MKTKIFTYWYVECLNDSRCYSIIAKTKKDAVQQLKDHWDINQWRKGGKLYVEKREIEYKNMFDLFDHVTGESGGRDTGWLVKTYDVTHLVEGA